MESTDLAIADDFALEANTMAVNLSTSWKEAPTVCFQSTEASSSLVGSPTLSHTISCHSMKNSIITTFLQSWTQKSVLL